MILVLRMRQLYLSACMVILLLSLGLWRLGPSLETVSTSTYEIGESTPNPRLAVDVIFALRAQALVKGDSDAIQALYAADSRAARWAYEHEVRRIKYVQAWAKKRKVKVVEGWARPKIVRQELRSHSLWLYVFQTAGYGYVYEDDPDQVVTRFGVGTRHVMELVLHDNKWVIKRDWYTDPLDEDTLVPEVTPALASVTAPQWVSVLLYPLEETETAQVCSSDLPVTYSPQARKGYNRDGAVAYADKYCGAAAGCGNNHRYHPTYRDYTGIGGDCTNFVSQALGDPMGGGLPMTGTWCYRGGAGSSAWVRAEGFANFLKHSGRAELLASGRYTQVTHPIPDLPREKLSLLQPGDVIGYEEKGRVVHFAIVTALDRRGLPLVNSHTADRYHVPWDMGWDRNTRFWLFRVRD